MGYRYAGLYRDGHLDQPRVMAEDSDPPRKFYRLKPTEFERVNLEGAPGHPVQPPAEAQPPSDPPGRIDVRELIRQGAAGTPLLSANQPANRPNDVHALLQEKYRHDQAGGLFHVAPGTDKLRRRRIRNYWTLFAVVNIPLAAIAWSMNPARGMGPASATVFVCALAGMAKFTAVWTWHTWFLRTER